MKKEIFKEIKYITSALIKSSLSIGQNFPVINGNNITWQGFKSFSNTLKNIPYKEKYGIFDKDNNYSIKMFDGALIQFMYEFSSNDKILISHRLAFFPSPGLEKYNASIDYEDKNIQVDNYSVINGDHVVAFPLRFDYDYSEENHIELEHPYSHLHLGDYPGCRMPVCSPLTPNAFINFILRNFYNEEFKNKNQDLKFVVKNKYSKCIGKKEKKIIHVNIE